MARQPSGTVTFLFSDIEGSTRLLQALGNDKYAVALLEHRALLREVFERHDGYEVDGDGDAFFVAFQEPGAAVAASAAAQEALAAHVWPDGQVLRVRVGVHTGQPLVAELKYVGLDVHRAARIMAAAHGGQVLVSAATAALLEGLGAELQPHALLDLGEHRFKDLAAAERVFQLGEGEFPPIRSLYRSNLPVPATPFLGRERELAEVEKLLKGEGIRLLTLTGPGGTGKTRLALQAAAGVSDLFPDGVWWVPLAALRDPELVLSAVAGAIGFEAGIDPLSAATAALAGRRLLLVIDNLEHLLPGAARHLADLVAAAPSLRLLVTSRERLAVSAEVAEPVGSMRAEDCVELFEARARAVGVVVAADPAVAAVCEALDGLPLAVELVAARTRMFTPSQLLDRLSKVLDLSAGVDADPRQRTLRATIGWSHDLLDDDERVLFARLAVFSGGSTLEAAERVCGASVEILLSLLDKNLLRRRDDDPETRFWMLETIREFALECLGASGEGGELRDRHADLYSALAHDAAPHMYASEDKHRWVARLDAEQPNLRVALEHISDTASAEALCALVVDLGRYWYLSGRSLDGLRWFTTVSGFSLPPDLRVRVDAGRAIFEAQQGNFETSRQLAEASVRVWRTLADTQGISDPLASLGVIAVLDGELDRALDYYGEALEQALASNDLYWEAAIRINVAEVLARMGRVDAAVQTLLEAEDAAARGGDEELRLLAANSRGSLYVFRGEVEEARPVLVDGVVRALRAGFLRIALYPLVGLARVAVEIGRLPEAALFLGAAMSVIAPGEIEPVHERNLAAETREALATALSREELDEGLARGASLGREELIALAESLRA